MSTSVTADFLPALRINRLSALTSAIANHQGRTDAFNALNLRDRIRILGALKIAKFDWTTIEKKGLKGRIRREIQTMIHELTSFQAKSASRYTFPFARIPSAVMTNHLGPYLTGKDIASFRSLFRTGCGPKIASHIIKHYQLESFIETYLLSSIAVSAENKKVRLLNALMSLVYELSEIEVLPKPSYRSLSEFFRLVEARNLIRMTESIHIEKPLPRISESVKSFEIPNDPKETIETAAAIRRFFAHHQKFLAKKYTVLDLDECNLSLLPKEISLLKQLHCLDLYKNNLVSLPKEIGRLKKLIQLFLSVNRVSVISKEIGQLKSLQELWLYDNRLATLPKELGQLKALRVLNLEKNNLVELPKGLEKFNDQLKMQDKKLQLKNLLNQLMWYLKNGHDCKGISGLLAKTEEFLGRETRFRLEHSLYEVCKKSPNTHRKLRAKLKNPLFSQRAFTDKEVDPKFKARAVAQFWNTKAILWHLQ